MTYNDALRYFGGTQARLGEACGVRQCTVSTWRGEIPLAHQLRLEVLSGGKLKADRRKLLAHRK